MEAMIRDEGGLEQETGKGRGSDGLVDVVLAPARWGPAKRKRVLAEAGMHLLFFLVGLAPWLLVNALFMQLPVFIAELPEGNSIASYLIIIIQLGNIIPIGYVVVRQYMRVPYNWVIVGTLGCGIATAILLGVFWDHTAHLFDSTRSVALMVLTLFAGLVGCFAVVSFFPFASLFKHSITAALSTGMGINGLVPSLLAAIQDPGGSKRFSVAVFFFIMGACLTLSLFSYVCILLLMNSARVRQHLEGAPTDQVRAPSQQPEPSSYAQSQRLLSKAATTGSDHEEVEGSSRVVGEADDELLLPVGPLPSLAVIRLLCNPLLNQFYICLINYVLVGMLPYAVSGYKDSGTWLMWTNIAATVTSSLGRFLCTWFRYYSLTWVSLAQTPLWVFLMVISLLGDRSLVPESLAFLIVVANALFTLLNGWEDTMAYIKVATEHPEIAERASTFVAAANQLGAFCGSLVSFLLVMVYLE